MQGFVVSSAERRAKINAERRRADVVRWAKASRPLFFRLSSGSVQTKTQRHLRRCLKARLHFSDHVSQLSIKLCVDLFKAADQTSIDRIRENRVQIYTALR